MERLKLFFYSYLCIFVSNYKHIFTFFSYTNDVSCIEKIEKYFSSLLFVFKLKLMNGEKVKIFLIFKLCLVLSIKIGALYIKLRSLLLCNWREEGNIGLWVTVVPKVLKTRYQILWHKLWVINRTLIGL